MGKLPKPHEQINRFTSFPTSPVRFCCGVLRRNDDILACFIILGMFLASVQDCSGLTHNMIMYITNKKVPQEMSVLEEITRHFW